MVLHPLKLCMKCHKLKYFRFFSLYNFLSNKNTTEVSINIYIPSSHYVIKIITSTIFNFYILYRYSSIKTCGDACYLHEKQL